MSTVVDDHAAQGPRNLGSGLNMLFQSTNLYAEVVPDSRPSRGVGVKSRRSTVTKTIEPER